MATALLVNIDDCVDEYTEKIHVNLNAYQQSDYIPIIKKGQWGEYSTKPKAQCDWDKQVRGAIAEIQTEHVNNVKDDMRPRFLDSTSGLSVLLDTGAQVSLWQKGNLKTQCWTHTKTCKP